jgi:FKBP-type peptidyl-prolyl cis-trans isomerase
VGDLMPGLRQSVRLVGEGGRMNVWIPSRLAYGAEGDKKLGVVPNATLFYEIELVDVR